MEFDPEVPENVKRYNDALDYARAHPDDAAAQAVARTVIRESITALQIQETRIAWLRVKIAMLWTESNDLLEHYGGARIPMPCKPPEVGLDAKSDDSAKKLGELFARLTAS